MASRSCLNSPNKFCYICGEFVLKKQWKPITDSVKVNYNYVFGIKIRNNGATWARDGICNTCYRYLNNCALDSAKRFPFVRPMIWMEPVNNLDDCYFCLMDANIDSHSSKWKKNLVYPNLTTTRRPVPYQGYIEDKPEPETDEPDQEEAHTEIIMPATSIVPSSSSGELVRASGTGFDQAALNDIVRELDLPKSHAQYLGSKFQERGYLLPGTSTSIYRNREV